MHCVTLRLGHTWSIELVATMRKQLQHPPDDKGHILFGGHHFYLTSMYTPHVQTLIIFMLPHEYNCTYNYALCGVQPLKQVAINLQQENSNYKCNRRVEVYLRKTNLSFAQISLTAHEQIMYVQSIYVIMNNAYNNYTYSL